MSLPELKPYPLPFGFKPKPLPLSYYGGKQDMAGKIVPLVPFHENRCEPFCGGMFFSCLPAPAGIETVNDINPFLVNYYEVARGYPDELTAKINGSLFYEGHYLKARKIHNEFKENGLDPLNFHGAIDAAWAFWMLCNSSFAARLGSGFAIQKKPSLKGGMSAKSVVSLQNKKKRMAYFCKRLENMQIFCRDAIEVIKWADGPGVWFFVDPPYVGSDQGHYKGYMAADFQKLLDCLSAIHGYFMLTHYPNPMLEEYVKKNGWIYREYIKALHAKKTEYTGKRETKTETITMNYKIKESNHLFSGIQEV